MYESLYVYHHSFNPDLNGWIDWQIEPKLVRSIEAWCHQHIYPITPIATDLIRDRAAVQEHFDRWLIEVRIVHQLDRSSILESLFQDLLSGLRQQPQDAIIERHWIAFLMHRGAVIGWRIWQMMPKQLQSLHLFQEIVSASYSQIDLQDPARLLANFVPGKSKLVNGINQIKAFVDRQIKFSNYPYLRELCGDPNFGRTYLGVAARHRRGEINRALQCAYSPGEVAAYLTLWQCFDIYKRETGTPVNLLTLNDFAQIGSNYQQLIEPHSSPPLSDIAVKRRLEDIGSAIRNYLLRQPLALDALIQPNDDNPTPFSDTTADRRQDLLETLAYQETWQLLQTDLDNFFGELESATSKPSRQQLFWLRYGLNFKQKQIGEVLHLNFKSTDNPGSASLRLLKAHRYLFERINSVIQGEPAQLTDKDINTTMGELLKVYFDRAMPNLVHTVANQLNLPPKLLLSSTHQMEFMGELIAKIENQTGLCLPPDITQPSLLQLVNRVFAGMT